MKTTVQDIIKSLTALTILAIVMMTIYAYIPAQDSLGSSFTGSAATLSTATTTTVGPQANTTIFSKTTSCTSRIITTNFTAIFFTTGDVTGFGSTTLANGNGLTQAASTTVAYDSGIYGCGRWTAEAVASTSITIVENQ